MPFRMDSDHANAFSLLENAFFQRGIPISEGSAGIEHSNAFSRRHLIHRHRDFVLDQEVWVRD